MDELERRMAPLKARFADRMRTDRDALREAWCDADRDGLRHIAHGLAGSAGIFGYPQLSEAARQLEQAIEGSEPNSLVERKLEAVLAEMRGDEDEVPGTGPDGLGL